MPINPDDLSSTEEDTIKKNEQSFFFSSSYEFILWIYFTMRKCHVNEIPERHSLNEIWTNPFNDVISQFLMLYMQTHDAARACVCCISLAMHVCVFDTNASLFVCIDNTIADQMQSFAPQQIDFFTASNLHIIYCVILLGVQEMWRKTCRDPIKPLHLPKSCYLYVQFFSLLWKERRAKKIKCL